MTKWPVQKPTHRPTQKHVEHQDATDIQKQYFLCFSDFFLNYIFLHALFKKVKVVPLAIWRVCFSV